VLGGAREIDFLADVVFEKGALFRQLPGRILIHGDASATV
jgi:hypothetical protein